MKAPFFLSVLAITGMSVLTGCQKDVVPDPGSAGYSVAAIAFAKKVQQQAHPLKAKFDAIGYVNPLSLEEVNVHGTFEGTSTLLGKFQGFFISRTMVNLNPGPYDPFVSILLNPLYQDFRSQYGDMSAVSASNRGYNIIATLPETSLDYVNVIVFDKQGNSMLGHVESSQNLALVEGRQYTQSTYSIVGGTGKFEGATGSYALNGYYTTVSDSVLDLHYELNGVIKY